MVLRDYCPVTSTTIQVPLPNFHTNSPFEVYMLLQYIQLDVPMFSHRLCQLAIIRQTLSRGVEYTHQPRQQILQGSWIYPTHKA